MEHDVGESPSESIPSDSELGVGERGRRYLRSYDVPTGAMVLEELS
jgi:hypothetical protein